MVKQAASEISVFIQPFRVVWYLRNVEAKFQGNFAFKSPFRLLIVLLLPTKKKTKNKTDDESFAIYMLSAAHLSQQTHFHMHQVQMQTIACNGN